MNELYAYYRNQALQKGGNILENYYKGERYSTPYLGLYGGSWFHKIIPSLVRKASDFVKTRAGKKIIGSLASVGSDVLSNLQREKNLKETVRDAIKKESKELLNQGLQQLQERISNRKRELEQSSDELLSGGSGAYFFKRQKLPRKYIKPLEDMKITDPRILKLIQALQPRGKGKRKPIRRKKKKRVQRKRRRVKKDKRKTKEIIKGILKPVLGRRKKTKRRVTFKLPGLL
jgi:hypothetical protein